MVKHAEARSVLLVASVVDGTLAIRVSDDGRGIDARRATDGEGGGFGLIGMRERADLAGGRLTIGSGDEGTTVALALPVPA